MDAIEQFEVGKFTVKIYQDEDAQNPRTEWDNFGKMVCARRRYNLGDEQMSPDEIEEITLRSDVLYLNLYLYEHSGITMSTTGFSCPWDSGQVGIIYVDRDMVFKEFGTRRFTKKLKYKVSQLLRHEVKAYDQYLTGDVYGYVVEDEDGENLDSCWGFYGFEYCKQEAESAAQYQVRAMLQGVAENVICVGMAAAV